MPAAIAAVGDPVASDLPAISTDKVAIESLERLRVSEFGKPARSKIAFFVGSEGCSEKFFAKWSLLQCVRDVGRDRLIFSAHPLVPGVIVTAQRLTQGKTNQTGAIALV